MRWFQVLRKAAKVDDKAADKVEQLSQMVNNAHEELATLKDRHRKLKEAHVDATDLVEHLEGKLSDKEEDFKIMRRTAYYWWVEYHRAAGLELPKRSISEDNDPVAGLRELIKAAESAGYLDNQVMILEQVVKFLFEQRQAVEWKIPDADLPCEMIYLTRSQMTMLEVAACVTKSVLEGTDEWRIAYGGQTVDGEFQQSDPGGEPDAGCRDQVPAERDCCGRDWDGGEPPQKGQAGELD